ARVITRPRPAIDLGPIDFSSSFIVVDAKKFDMPIVYASNTFENLTGYSAREIIGKNCRFLQSPDGLVQKGAVRSHVDNNVVYQLKTCVDRREECQYININYRKGGAPFVNLITIIPLADENGSPEYFVGFQVDLMQQSGAILRRLEDNHYVIDMEQKPTIPVSPRLLDSASPTSDDLSDDQAPKAPENDVEPPFATTPELSSIVSLDDISSRPSTDSDDADPSWHCSLVNDCPDVVHILSSRGIILFASPHSCRDVFEYEAGEVIGRNISKFCHPGDLISLMRELKCCGVDESISAAYRFRRKHSGYAWIEVTGHKYEMKNRKRTKCFILSARERVPGELTQGQILGPMLSIPTAQDPHELWGKITREGFFLYISPTSSSIFGVSNEELYGRSLLDFIYEGDRHL
ncbi:hypothetical protein BDK51DRAFT_12097, partial [Blyttiomyces helicus]